LASVVAGVPPALGFLQPTRLPLQVMTSRLLVNRHVLVVVFQRLTILCDLDSVRIENANRDMFSAKFNRAIRRRNPSFEGRTSAFIANSHLYIGSFKRSNGNAILLARFRRG